MRWGTLCTFDGDGRDGPRWCERSGGPASHTREPRVLTTRRRRGQAEAEPEWQAAASAMLPGAQAGSSVVERGLYTARAAGSIPVPPTG